LAAPLISPWYLNALGIPATYEWENRTSQEARSANPDEKCPLEMPDLSFGPLERPNPRFRTEFQNLLEVVVDSDRFGSFLADRVPEFGIRSFGEMSGVLL